MIDKGRECRKYILDKKRANLLLWITQESSEVDILLHSFQNDVAVTRMTGIS